MKVPKTTKRHCPFCKKHTEHKIKLLATGGTRGALKKGSPTRAKKRGENRGFGNKGRYSKPPISKWKRKTKSTTKKVLIYTCQECKKSHQLKKGIRAGKLLIE